MRRAADNLVVVHAVLETRVAGGSRDGDVKRAVAETKQVEARLNDTADKLVQVNETVKRELGSAR